MKIDKYAFYKKVYSFILDFMEYIDNQTQPEHKYYFEEYEENTILDLQRSKIYSFSSEDTTVTIPEHNFLDYAFEIKGLHEGFKYLPNLSEEITIEELKDFISSLNKDNIDNPLTINSPISNKITSQVNFEKLVEFRNQIEAKVLEFLFEKELLKSYKTLTFEDFFKQNNNKFSKYEIDLLNYLNMLNEKIKNKDKNIPKVDWSDAEALSFCKNLLGKISKTIKATISERFENIKNISIDNNFEINYQTAQKLKQFSRCTKDYICSPKDNGYQSLHAVVQTPWGPYEVQFRTEEQDNFSEYGDASHSKDYKEYEKVFFHRLKVPTILTPKRDENGDIIVPLELVPLRFELCVLDFYKQPFSNFAGITLEEFKENYENNFDEAMFVLSSADASKYLIKEIFGNNELISKKPKHPVQIATRPPESYLPMSDVPLRYRDNYRDKRTIPYYR